MKRGAVRPKNPKRVALAAAVLLLLLFGYTPFGRTAWTELGRACHLLPFAQSLPKSDVTIYAVNVGKADAILIETPDGAVLSDCATAEQAETVLRILKLRNIRSLRAVWISHADSDHAGGLAKILEEVPAEEIVTSAYTDLPDLPSRYTVKTAAPGETLRYGEAEFHVLAPIFEAEGTNENSLVYKFTYRSFSALFCGDIEEKAEAALLEKYGETGLLRADVLKVPHHGSASSCGTEFLKAVQPRYAVISSGEDRNLLPRNETLKRLSDCGAEILRTDEDGSVVLETDGTDIQIYTENGA